MTVNNTTTKGKDMTIKRLRLVYRVYFQHPTLNISHQDVEAYHHMDAESQIASEYMLATHIKAVPISRIFPDYH